MSAPPDRRRRPPAARTLLATATVVVVLVLCIWHRQAISAGGAVLKGVDREWLTLALLATAMMWVAGTITQLGSMSARPPVGRLFATQIAASFVNHLMPAGSGGAVINVRFLQRHGMSRGAAVGAVALNSLAGMITHLLLLLAALAVAPVVLAGAPLPGGATSWMPSTGHAWWAAIAESVVVAVAAVLLAAAGVAALTRRARLSSHGWAVRYCGAVAHVGRELRSLVAVLRDPARAVKLWSGSLATPMLHSLILLFVLRGIGSHTPAVIVVVVYLAGSAVAALVPSPGGLGLLDVTIVAGLIGVGESSTTALAAMLGYRLVTVWVPLLPGACVFAIMLRRRLI